MPIFQADFLPVSYGFRPMRRAHDAIAEIQRYGTKGYQWISLPTYFGSSAPYGPKTTRVAP